MEFFLNRLVKHSEGTLGTLSIQNEFFCFTLEDTVRDIKPDGTGKIKGATAIPEGRYQVIISKSVRFKKNMPLLLDVPHFSGIRIHAGNNTSHTEGCILLGMAHNGLSISASQLAVVNFTEILRNALSFGKVWLVVR